MIVMRVLFLLLLVLALSICWAVRPNEEGEGTKKTVISVHTSGHFQLQDQGVHSYEAKRQVRAARHDSTSLAQGHDLEKEFEGSHLFHPGKSEDKKGAKSEGQCEADQEAPADPTAECPSACPYSAEVAAESEHCHFKCVKPNECGSKGLLPKATIPDEDHHFCRVCEVEACLECVAGKPGEEDDGVETCKKCMFGYQLSADGKMCWNPGNYVFFGLIAIGVLLALIALFWYINLIRLPVVNGPAVQYALECQTRTMVLQDHHGDEGQPYPFSANLCSVNIAGPGTIALFRFQAAVLIWAIVLMILWFGFVFYVSTDLLFVGNRPAITPRQLCEVVAWGRRRQMELIWTKVSWLAFAYVFSTVGAFAYGLWMAKFFRDFDSGHHTPSDYVAILTGVPKMKGEEKVEDIIAGAVKEAIGDEISKDLVTVSVGWNFEQHAAQVRHFLEDEVGSLEASRSTQRAGARLSVMHLAATVGSVDEEAGCFSKMFAGVTRMILAARHVHLDEHTDGEEAEIDNLKKNLHEMETAEISFVVFMTETARDAAIKAVQESGIKIGDATCRLKAETHEPEALFWHNLHVTEADRFGKYLVNIVNIILACVAWTVVLYLPYAHYMSSFSYANGDEPGLIEEGTFVGLVVGAQIGLFIASSIAADRCQPHYEDDKHNIYIIYYNGALVLNLIMDIALQSYLSYLQMVGVGAHVADGRLLGDLTSWQEIFECYPVQKSVGKLLFKYCWPCTFLLPFLAEPFGCQLLPLHLGQLLVGANPKLQGEQAERALELSEMEQGRYADCIFNLVLVACIPFIAPAYMAMTYMAFIVSHIYIYMYDQWKALRYARKFYFTSDSPHFLGQKLFCLPVAIIAAALVMKANQWSGGVDGGLGGGVLKGWNLGAACAGAFCLHIIVHLSLLHCVVKPFGKNYDKAPNATPFSEVAALEAATHITTNPVQCLRSKYILNDSPPLSIFCLGKEHLMRPNPKLGAYFDGLQSAHSKHQGEQKPFDAVPDNET